MADMTPDDIKKSIEDVASLKYEMFGAEDAARQIFKTFNANSAVIRDTLTVFTKIKAAISDTENLYSKLGTQYISSAAVLKRINESTTLITTQNQKIKNILDDQFNGEQDIDKILAIKFGKKDKEKKLSQEALKIIRNQVDALTENLTKQNEILDALPQQNDEADKMIFKGVALKKILEGIAKIPVLGGLVNWQRVADEMNVMNEETGKFEKFDGKKGIAELGKQLKTLASDPLIKGLIGGYILSKVYDISKIYVQLILDINKQVNSLATNLGMSTKAGNLLYDSFYNSSHIVMGDGDSLVKGLDVAFLSIRNMVAATTDLQESLGTNAMFTDEMVQSQILLTKQMKFSSEEAAGIQKLSLITGKSADNILQTTIKQNTAGLSYRKIIKEVAGISAELSMRLGNNPERIAAAVVQANKFGMSLEETRKISSSLLNFESSIEGELESELLLGKQFNFEKARELALMGKSSEAAGELLTQIGGITELEKMNVIQRERVAAAIGLSSDELSKSAIQQEVLNKLGLENKEALDQKIKKLRESNDLAGIAALQEEASKVQGGKVLLQDIARVSQAEHYEEIMNRVKDILEAMVANSTMFKIIFVSLAAIAAGFAASMVTAAISSVIATGGLSAAGAGLAVGTLAAIGLGTAVAFATPVRDSMTAPGGKTISMPKGTLLPDKNDYVYTSTNPLPTGGSGGNDNALISKIDELIYHTRKGKVIQYDTYTSTTAASIGGNQYA